MAVTLEPLFLPALQGSFGDWTYYSALVRLDDVVERVGYATLLQENTKLADQIQRRLDNRNRAEDIAAYLVRNDDRFFNALVVGVYGGQPEWHPFSLSSRVPAHELGAVTERDQDLVGYLHLSGEERMFALDGQHRLAGIKRAIEAEPKLGAEKLAVLFVPHVGSRPGLIRTRSLFISLNKKVVPVKRKDIIILDEVDLAAIVTRRLVDSDPRFAQGVIDVERFGSAVPAASTFWTTIGNFYDVNKIIINGIVDKRSEEELKEADKVRLSEDRILFYQNGVTDFYARLAKSEPLLAAILSGDRTSIAAEVSAARTRQNPRLLARPIGLRVVARVVAEMRKTMSMKESFDHLGRVPMSMDKTPFANVIWDPERGKMDTRGEGLAVRLLAYMLGLTTFDERLRRSYADWFGLDPSEVRAPRRFSSPK